MAALPRTHKRRALPFPAGLALLTGQADRREKDRASGDFPRARGVPPGPA